MLRNLGKNNTDAGLYKPVKSLTID